MFLADSNLDTIFPLCVCVCVCRVFPPYLFVSQKLNVQLPLPIGHKHVTKGASQVSVVVKNLPTSAGDAGSVPGLGRSLEEGMATHSSILAWRIPMDRGACWATVHGVAKSWT